MGMTSKQQRRIIVKRVDERGPQDGKWKLYGPGSLLARVSVKGMVGNLLMLSIYAYWFVYATAARGTDQETQAGPSALFFPISLIVAASP
jgi:hypothetical protein